MADTERPALNIDAEGDVSFKALDPMADTESRMSTDNIRFPHGFKALDPMADTESCAWCKW